MRISDWSSDVCSSYLDMGRSGRRLEAARAPAAIDVEARHRGLAEDRRAVGRDVDDASPFAQHAHAREDRKHLTDRRNRMLDERQPATLAVRDILVGAGADNELALVGLRDIGVDRKSTRLNSSH